MLNGELEYVQFSKDSILSRTDEAMKPVDLSATKIEIGLRERVNEEEKWNSESQKAGSKKKIN